MNIFNLSMKPIFALFWAPLLIIGQEFYPGFLAPVDEPICYNTSTELSFEALPSGTNNNLYSYQWQISWNQSNWFNISNANSTTYTTDDLNSDVYYRVLVSTGNITLPTNTINIWVLPPLEAGVLLQPNVFCDNEEIRLDFYADGAEWWWGGFLNFSYQWEQNTTKGPPFVSSWDTQKVDGKGWFKVGEDINYFESYLQDGFYYFRCLVTSPYGCGSVYTNTVMVKVDDCLNGRMGKDINSYEQKNIITTTSILGGLGGQSNIRLTIYNDGSVSKEYVLQ